MKLSPTFGSVITVGKRIQPLSLHAFLTGLIVLCVLPLVLLAIYLATNHIEALQAEIEDEAGRQVRNLATAIDKKSGHKSAPYNCSLLRLSWTPPPD